MILDKVLKDEFRELVNKEFFVLHVYVNEDEKNKWNCICSAMDWIDVSVDFINSPDSYQRNKLNINIDCMYFYTLISSIDILWEAIQQLNRVFFKNNQIPFKGERSCFMNRAFNEDDNKYFKTIRSCFGAHPINLDDPNMTNNKKLKRYASWPYSGIAAQSDYEVRLYSNQINEGDIIFGVNVNEIINFSKQRYFFLRNIMKEIDRQYEEFCNMHKKNIINLGENLQKNLVILKEESVERLNCDYYNYTIEKLDVIFSLTIEGEKNNLVLNEFRNSLEQVISEIHQNLQSMNFVDLKTDSILSPKCPPNLRYSFSKISDAFWEDGHFVSYHDIYDYFRDSLEFEYINNADEIYVMTLAGFYYKR